MDTDLIIVGTGQAGVPLATRLAHAGKSVLLVERGEPGGTCINTGCTPTKTLLASAHAAHAARNAERLGVRVADAQVDYGAAMRRKETMVASWRKGVEHRIAAAGARLTFLRGHARFVDERTLEVAGERHHGDQIVLNVGARASTPDVPGLSTVPWLDNRRLLELPELPRHLLVLGGGYIGCELGQMFRRFGSHVTMIAEGPHLLSRSDPEVGAELEAALAADGVTLKLGQQAQEVENFSDGVRLVLSGGEVLRGSHLLVATGRRPNTDELGCEAGGVRLDTRGDIVVDLHYRTSAPGVFAVGDVIPQPQFTHVSWDDHRLLFDLLTGRGQRARSDRQIPYTLFTEPQVAGVGLTETAAQDLGIPHEVARMPFAKIARALETDQPRGLIQVLIDPQTELILGATIVGAEAGELIHVFVALMHARASARTLVEAECVHPTFAEGLQSALMTLPRFALP